MPWKKEGIDTDHDDHESYMSDFCETISARLHELISRHIKQDPEVKARNKNIQEVYNEVVAHLSINEKLNSERTESWWTGSDTLNKVKTIITSSFQAGKNLFHENTSSSEIKQSIGNPIAFIYCNR